MANAPATFQNQINDTFSGVLNKFVIGYMDDILVYSKNWAEHLVDLRDVFSRLRKDKLYGKLAKCEFGQSKVQFLGHIIEDGKVSPRPDKIAVVKEWTRPSDVASLRSFLGLANYFRKFIQGYAIITLPLNLLLKKGVTWSWDEEHEIAFQAVKDSLCELTALKLPDLNAPFEVIADASTLGIGTALLQEGRPVAYIGRKLSSAEKSSGLY